MAEFLSKHMKIILLSSGVASVSAAIGYMLGAKKKRGEKHTGKRMKSYHNEEDQLMAYILENSLREPAFLRDLREETRSRTGNSFGMIADPLEAQFLRLFLRTYGAKR